MSTHHEYHELTSAQMQEKVTHTATGHLPTAIVTYSYYSLGTKNEHFGHLGTSWDILGHWASGSLRHPAEQGWSPSGTPGDGVEQLDTLERSSFHCEYRFD